jgi:hypothetical protein
METRVEILEHLQKTGKFTLSTPGKIYNQLIGNKPLLEALVLGAGGATAGYMGGKFMARKALAGVLAGKSPAEREAILRELESEDTSRFARRLGGVLGGLVGVAYPLQKAWRRKPGSTWKDQMGAMLSTKGQEDEALYRTQQALKPRPKKALGKKPFVSGRTPGMNKYQSFEFSDPFVSERVPISYSIDLIQRDPFLSIPQKAVTTGLLEGSAGGAKAGSSSGMDLTKAAIRAGVGFGTAYAFGRAATSVLGLPLPQAKKVSQYGGLAGALVNTGIFQELGK